MLAFFGMGSAAMANKLKIEVMQEGDGDVAEHGQRVTLHYEGRLTDDTVFDASRPRGHPFSFTIGAGQVIQGWEQGVTGMKVGEMRRLTIPAELGYGATGAGGVIPAHATLVFDIELLTVNVPVSLGQATPADLLQAQKEVWLSLTSAGLMNGCKQASLRGPKPLPPLKLMATFILILSNSS